jgi:hypothetical protein
MNNFNNKNNNQKNNNNTNNINNVNNSVPNLNNNMNNNMNNPIATTSVTNNAIFLTPANNGKFNIQESVGIAQKNYLKEFSLIPPSSPDIQNPLQKALITQLQLSPMSKYLYKEFSKSFKEKEKVL